MAPYIDYKDNEGYFYISIPLHIYDISIENFLYLKLHMRLLLFCCYIFITLSLFFFLFSFILQFQWKGYWLNIGDEVPVVFIYNKFLHFIRDPWRGQNYFYFILSIEKLFKMKWTLYILYSLVFISLGMVWYVEFKI